MIRKYSEYMHFAKTQQKATYNLATSGVGAFPLKELPFDCTALEINGDNNYGYKPLLRAIAQRSGVDPDCVVTAEGTSFANFLAMATILNPGDEVLIENPHYGLLSDTAQYIGAEVRLFPRLAEEGYGVNPARVREAMSPRTKLIVLTNLHNPSSVLTPDATLREVVELARSVGARVLVDEVYLDAVYENTPRTSFHLGPEVVVTNSLTKVYGVSGLRCGWILAEPELARAMWQLNNLFAASPVHPGELMSVAAFEHLDILRDRARKIVDADRKALNDFLDRESGVSAVRTEWGTTSFLKLEHGEVEPFLQRLRSEQETSAVPGRFFGSPDRIRIGMGVNHEMFAEGLRRISLTLSR